jgi:hypothetical protein
MLAALAARERALLPAPEWEALARGEIDADEAAARARARGASEAEVARASELFAPRSSESDDALADRLIAHPGPGVVELPRRRAAAWIVPTAALAIAASLVLWLALRPRPAGDAPAVLPAHEVWLEPAAAQLRSAQAGVRVRPGDAIAVFLRPESAYAVQPHAWACLESDDAGIRSLQTVTRSAEPGRTIELSAELPRDLTAGAWDLVAVVSPTPRPAADGDACAVASQPTWRVQRVGFVVQTSP